MSRRPTVAILHLGSAGSMGGRRRVASLEAIFASAGAEVVEVALLAEHRTRPADAGRVLAQAGAVARGRIVPEALAWSHRRVAHQLRRIDADVVVCISARAFHPTLLDGPWTVVVDYVDRLSDSYADRARILGRTPRSLVFRTLATTSSRFERHPLPEGVVGIAAGSDDADSLGLAWVPNTMELPADGPRRAPDHDVLFLGKLSFAPNVEAIERLGAVWPRVQAVRPGTTLLLAGAAPTPAILELAAGLGWAVEADFADLADVVASARVAAAPLRHASGIQSKVLEAASFGLPQVIGTAVAKGFGPGMPAVVVDTDDDLVRGLTELLDDPEELHRLGLAVQEHIGRQYAMATWTPWAREVLQAARR